MPNASNQCTRCGALLTAFGPDALCPNCMAHEALGLPPTVQDSGGANRNDSHPSTDTEVFGDYELIDQIAAGGMGIVWYARQLSVNRFVALKMILAGHLATAEQVQRFRTEAEAAANLDHPNIVPVYGAGEHEGQHYISMK